MENRDQCFSTLIDRDLPMLQAAAFRITGNAADAEEAIQNAMLSAWKSFSSFRNEAKFTSWIYRITVNAAYNLVKKQQREERKIKEYAKEVSPIQEKPDRRLGMLRKAIARLPEKYREAIAIGMLNGFSGEKAAEILDCSVDALYQRISRAKTMLKQIIENEVAE